MGPIKPGDRFFRVQDCARSRVETDWVVVVGIGTRWATFVNERHVGLSHVVETARKGHAGHRFDLETLRIDGGNFTSPGYVYRSEEEYRDNMHRRALWLDLRKQIDWQYIVPAKLTAIDILKAADALGFRLKEE